MLLIRKSVLMACLAASRAAYPRETMVLLTGRMQKGDLLIEGLAVPPGLTVDEVSAHYTPWMLPASLDHLGTFHSHPGFSNRPSRPDLLSASKEGGVHLIACQPFTLEDIKAYDSAGRSIEYRAV